MFNLSKLQNYISNKITGFDKEFMSNDLNRILTLVPMANYEDLLSDINFHKGFLNLADVKDYAYKYSKSNLKSKVTKDTQSFISKIGKVSNLAYSLALKESKSTKDVFARWRDDGKEFNFYCHELNLKFTENEKTFISLEKDNKKKGLEFLVNIYDRDQNMLSLQIYNYFWNLQMDILLPISKNRVLEEVKIKSLFEKVG